MTITCCGVPEDGMFEGLEFDDQPTLTISVADHDTHCSHCQCTIPQGNLLIQIKTSGDFCSPSCYEEVYEQIHKQYERAAKTLRLFAIKPERVYAYAAKTFEVTTEPPVEWQPPIDPNSVIEY